MNEYQQELVKEIQGEVVQLPDSPQRQRIEILCDLLLEPPQPREVTPDSGF